jgi:hypothetical protein
VAELLEALTAWQQLHPSYGMSRDAIAPISPSELLAWQAGNAALLAGAQLNDADRRALQQQETEREPVYQRALVIINAMHKHARPVIETLEREGINSTALIRLTQSPPEASALPQAMIDLQRLAAKLAAKSPTVNTPAASRDPKLEARDKWIYQQCCKGRAMSYPNIIAELRRKSKAKGWKPIESVQGIRRAANTYADNHNLSRPPRRQDF